MKNNRRINIVSVLCVSLLMAASTLIMSAGNTTTYCKLRCNYGTPFNPVWSAWLTWTCPNGYQCELDCTGDDPKGRCYKD